EFGGVDGAVGVAVEVAFAAGANVCRTGSHRGRSGDPAVLLQTSLPTSCCRSTLWVRMCARPVRTGGGAPTDEPVTTPYCRSTRPGCECVPDRFAPGGPAIRRCSYR